MNTAKAILSGLACISLASASARKDARQQLTTIYSGLSKAFAQKNIAAYEKVLAKDFTVTDRTGKVLTRAVVLKSYSSQMKAMKNASWERKLISVVSKGSNTVVSVRSIIRADVSGGDGKLHHLQIVASATDTWKSEGAKWVLLRSKLESTTGFLDGRQVNIQ
jgi:ketosteroid isomerase-like protein